MKPSGSSRAAPSALRPSGLCPLCGSTCVVDGVSPQQMCYVLSPGGLLLPVLGLQSHTVPGTSGLTHPDLEPDAVLTHVLSETHLARLPEGGRGGGGGTQSSLTAQSVRDKTGERNERNSLHITRRAAKVLLLLHSVALPNICPQALGQSVSTSIHLSLHRSLHLSFHYSLSISLSITLYLYLSSSLSISLPSCEQRRLSAQIVQIQQFLGCF